jgi:hypothetical protein
MIAKDDKIFDSDDVSTALYVFVANIAKDLKFN